VLNRAPEQTLAQLKQSIRRAVLRLDPATAEQRRQRARADRHLRVTDAGHGMGWLVLLLPIDQAKACYPRADAIARTAAKPDPRTMDQLRTDAVVDALLTGNTGEGGLHPPCERHHMGKHTAGWKVRRNPDGTTTWTSPQGRQYTTRPPERWTQPPRQDLHHQTTRTLDPAQRRLSPRSALRVERSGASRRSRPVVRRPARSRCRPPDWRARSPCAHAHR
jgi:hypothetical protein